MDGGTLLAAKSRRIMSGVDVCKGPRGRIEARQENRDKCCEMDIVNIKAVDAFQNLSRGIGVRRHRPDGSLQAAHEHPGGYAVPTYIRDHQSVCSIAELEEIEIVAPDDLGRAAEGSQFDASDVGHALRQQGALHDL